jgi:cell division protein FtsB
MKKPALVIGFLLFTVFVLFLVKISVSNQVATSGVVLSEVSQSLDSLKLENTLLSEEFYKLSALTTIETKAQALGYVEPKENFVLNGQVPVAIKQ